MSLLSFVLGGRGGSLTPAVPPPVHIADVVEQGHLDLPGRR